MSYQIATCPLCVHSSGGCTGACTRHSWPWPTIQRGCICPPGSEQTCRRSDCGRRDPVLSTGTAYNTGDTP
jgi:hypothetical protein